MLGDEDRLHRQQTIDDVAAAELAQLERQIEAAAAGGDLDAYRALRADATSF